MCNRFHSFSYYVVNSISFRRKLYKDIEEDLNKCTTLKDKKDIVEKKYCEYVSYPQINL